jgi:crotonobetainyl-CoA:carnitine CoA-transferase CaiB-like acyl-CoA transferase
VTRFTDAKGTIAPICAIDQIADDPQAKARQMITRLPDRDFGSVAVANVVPRFTVDPAELRHTAGDIGQDNREVYQGWLGLSEQEIEEFARRKVI